MEQNHLYVLWTNTDPVTAEHMLMMYVTNAKLHHWWDEVTVIIWGGPDQLLAESEALQLKLKLAQQAGVKFSACSACADNLRLRAKLEELGIEVKPWGPPLTRLIQEGAHLLTI